MRVRKDDERSIDNLSIRMKPSIKVKLRLLAEHDGVRMAEQIELMIIEKWNKLSLDTRIKLTEKL